MDSVFAFLSDLRVSDAEREEVVDFLKRHFAQGRLTEAELSARIDAVYRARHESQLEALVRDLPHLPVPAPAPRRTARFGGAAATVLALVAVVAVAAAVPVEVWAQLLALGLPLLMVLLFTVAPFALPVLGFLWLARAMSGPRSHVRAPYARPALPPHRAGDWVSVWDVGRAPQHRRHARR